MALLSFGVLVLFSACQVSPQSPITAIAQGYEDVLFRDVRHASWSPDGAFLVVTIDYGGNQELDLLSADGTFISPLARSSGYEGVGQWSATRGDILFQTNRDAEDGPAFSLYTMQPDGTDLKRLLPVDFPVMFGRWSPDGTRLVFNDVAQSTPRQLHIFDKATNTVNQLTSSDTFHSDYGSWSPGGQWLLFESTRDGSWDTYRMRPDGSEVMRIGLGTSSAPRYSPDGTLIAFHEMRNGHDYDIFIADANGSNTRVLTDGPGDQRLPEWSPDGTRLVYVSNAGGHHDLFSIRGDGTDATQLTQQPAKEFFTLLRQQGFAAASAHMDTTQAFHPELKIFRDERGLVLAIHQARHANNTAYADALLEIAFSIFPESDALQALQSGDATPY